MLKYSLKLPTKFDVMVRCLERGGACGISGTQVSLVGLPFRLLKFPLIGTADRLINFSG